MLLFPGYGFFYATYGHHVYNLFWSSEAILSVYGSGMMMEICRTRKSCRMMFTMVVLMGVFPALIGLFLSPIREAWAVEQEVPAAIRHLVKNGGFLVEKNGCPVVSYNPHDLFVPASIWKIITALMSLSRLGPEYRFVTDLYQDKDGNLFIRGSGDPFLVSEEVEQIGNKLYEKGISRVKDICVDDFAFAPSPIPGAGQSLNPYDAANGALVVNFNTLYFQKAPDGSVFSAEPQTPTIPLMAVFGNDLPVGSHRINVSINQTDTVRYVGELFRAILKQEGIAITGEVRHNQTPKGLAPVLHHFSSKDLREIISSMLRYSNNYIANQLFLQEGARKYGFPATVDKGREALCIFVYDELGLTKDEVCVDEGSGLSRRNRISPAAMLNVLSHFKPYADLLPVQEGVKVKSGTLSNVFSYAGYFGNENGLDGFVLILNQKENTRDELLRSLFHLYQRKN